MPNPTTSRDWPQQQAINRMIGEGQATRSAAIAAAQAALATLQSDIATQQGLVDDFLSYLGEDCAGGDCVGSTPPYGDCGNCTSGTPANYTLDFASVDLTGEATANVAGWNAFFNGNLFVLAQVAQCDWQYIENTTPGDYDGTVVESVEFLIAISGTDVTVTINGYDADDAGGALVFSTTIQIVESDDDPAAPGNCSALPATADHLQLTGDWATAGVGTFDLNFSPPGTGGTLTWPG